MKLLYKSLLGIVVIGIIFYFTNMLYARCGWEKDIQKIDGLKMLTDLNDGMDRDDIFYFAESSNSTYSEKDTITKSISAMTNDCFSKLKISSIERGALHAGVYKKLISNIRKDAKVKTIIVTMNLRSFGSNWINSSAENNCQELQIAYSDYPPLLKKMMFVFRAYSYKEDWERTEDYINDITYTKIKGPLPLPFNTAREWDNYIANNLFRDSNGIENRPKIELACHNVKIFGFNIDTLTNPRIKDFDEIVELCKKKKIKLFFNLLAENTEYADSLVGKELLMVMRENKTILVNYYSRKGVTVIDNFELVKGIDYIDQSWTTEHYNQAGRKVIARNMAKTLNQEFPEYIYSCIVP